MRNTEKSRGIRRGLESGRPVVIANKTDGDSDELVYGQIWYSVLVKWRVCCDAQT